MGITRLYISGSILFVLILTACNSLGQFTHKKPWPTYSLQNMPQTGFTCHDKILGGYYADPEAQCQMFHVCVKVAGVGVQDFRFLCPNGTAFDQEVQICANWGDVDCEEAVLYYGSDNFDLYRLGSGFESKRAPLAEEEESTFHLQRAETSDIRRSKETQVDQKLRPESLAYTKKYDSTTKNSFYERDSDNRKSNYDQNRDFNKITSKSNFPKKTTSSYYTTPRGNDINSESKQDVDDLFKGSHSSNFFSNRNGGREDDFYDKPVTSSTTSTSKQYINENGPQNVINDFNYFSDKTTKRPHRSRRPNQSNQNILTATPTITTAFPTTKRLTLETSFNAGFDHDNHPYPSTTTTTTTQRPTSKQPAKFAFGPNDYQQNIQPTTYNPSGAFRYKSTTSKYDEINETALRGEKPGQSTFLNSQYENQNDVFNKVSNRKSSNSENNFEKQQSKNTTFANRNEFTDFTKNKTPSGFQVSPKLQQDNSVQRPVNLNAQLLDPNSLNSELRSFNQTQLNQRRTSNNRYNERQQTEPQYFRSRTLETPAPFAVPRNQQETNTQTNENFNGSPQKDFNRLKVESSTPNENNVDPLQKPKQQQIPKTFDGRNHGYLPLKGGSQTKSEQKKNLDVSGNSEFDGLYPPQRESSRTRPNKGSVIDTHSSFDGNNARDFAPRSQSKQNQQSSSNGNTNQQVNSRAEQRTGIVEQVDSFPQTQGTSQFDSEFQRSNLPLQEVRRIKPRTRTGSVSNVIIPKDSFQQSNITSTTVQPSPKPGRGRGRVNYKSTTQQQSQYQDNIIQSTTTGLKKFSTLVTNDQFNPTTFRPTTYKKAFEQKPTKYVDPKQRGTPYTTTTTPLPSIASQSFNNTPDEDDGQYHPELYEVDDSQNYDFPQKQQSHSVPSSITLPQQKPLLKPNSQTIHSPQSHLQSQQQTAFQKQSYQSQNNNNYQPNRQDQNSHAIPTDLSDEEELFKTAHSLNLGAASINKLRSDTFKTSDKTTQQSSSSSFGFDRSTYPTKISSASSTTTTTWRPTTKYIASSTTIPRTSSISKKPKKSSSSKRPPHADADTSYDYAYYDSLSETPQEYSEYDVISEFRKTTKKQ